MDAGWSAVIQNSLQKVGAEVADLALEVLGGTDPAAMPPRPTGGNANRVDWRQIKRWGFKESALPRGTDIRYRMPTLWEQYHWHIIGIIALILVLTAIVATLAIERRRRRGAEVDLRQRVLEVFHLNSSAVAGALSASVVHEIRQPLGAIMNYAEAASLHLKTEPPNIERVEQILASIRLDDKRAVDIVAHLRELLKKRDETELEQFNLNDVVHEAVQIVRPEARKRGLDINACQTTGRLEVRGDRIQLRQVILNLAMNALDAMQNCAPGGKVFVETAMASDSTAEVIVADLGIGISADKLNQVFDAFYTTKRHGTGLGLPIARSIIETYGGKIWADKRAGGGAVFYFTLPLSRMAVA